MDFHFITGILKVYVVGCIEFGRCGTTIQGCIEFGRRGTTIQGCIEFGRRGTNIKTKNVILCSSFIPFEFYFRDFVDYLICVIFIFGLFGLYCVAAEH